MKTKIQKSPQNDKPLTVGIFLEVLQDLRENTFSQFATREDLERFATKEEVRLIVKDELAGYATKEDLQKEIGSFRDELKEEIQEFREETNANFERLFEGAYETGKTLKEHEKRIQKLEAA